MREKLKEKKNKKVCINKIGMNIVKCTFCCRTKRSGKNAGETWMTDKNSGKGNDGNRE